MLGWSDRWWSLVSVFSFGSVSWRLVVLFKDQQPNGIHFMPFLWIFFLLVSWRATDSDGRINAQSLAVMQFGFIVTVWEKLAFFVKKTELYRHWKCQGIFKERNQFEMAFKSGHFPIIAINMYVDRKRLYSYSVGFECCQLMGLRPASFHTDCSFTYYYWFYRNNKVCSAIKITAIFCS